SHAPAAARHTAPALPAGCWQVACVPSQVSVVQGLLSSVQAVPLAFFASAGQLGPLPGQLSATSHSPPTARQTTLAAWKPSAGQLLPAPSQVSASSQVPAEARQTVPADFNLQFALQQELAEPFAAPSSHSSPEEFTAPSPHDPSVKVARATLPDVRPVAVSVNVTPRSLDWTTSSLSGSDPP